MVVKISSSNVEPPGAVGGNKKILKFYIYTHTYVLYIHTYIAYIYGHIYTHTLHIYKVQYVKV